MAVKVDESYFLSYIKRKKTKDTTRIIDSFQKAKF